jgi:hypothetical protein
MKKVLSVLAALAVIGSASCFGAAAVSLNNYDANHPIYLTGTTLAGTGCYIQIYGGADAASAVALTSTGGGNGVFSLADDPGFFDGGIGNIPGLADGAQATLVAHVWQGDGTPGAWANAGQNANVATWTQATGANTPPNLPAPAALAIPAGVTIVAVPEPTTLALGLIGAAGLLFFRRK